MTMGRMSSDIVSAPASTLLPSASHCTNNARPSSPYTIDGTPARFDMLISMIEVSLFFGAYSSRYIAAPIPVGTVNAAVSPISHRVPTIAALSPASSVWRDG